MEANWAVVVEEEDAIVVVGERVVVYDDRLLLILVPLRLPPPPPPPPGNRVGVVNANEFIPRRASISRAETSNETNAPKAVAIRRLLPPVMVSCIVHGLSSWWRPRGPRRLVDLAGNKCK